MTGSAVTFFCCLSLSFGWLGEGERERERLVISTRRAVASARAQQGWCASLSSLSELRAEEAHCPKKITNFSLSVFSFLSFFIARKIEKRSIKEIGERETSPKSSVFFLDVFLNRPRFLIQFQRIYFFQIPCLPYFFRLSRFLIRRKLFSWGFRSDSDDFHESLALNSPTHTHAGLSLSRISTCWLLYSFFFSWQFDSIETCWGYCRSQRNSISIVSMSTSRKVAAAFYSNNWFAYYRKTGNVVTLSVSSESFTTRQLCWCNIHSVVIVLVDRKIIIFKNLENKTKSNTTRLLILSTCLIFEAISSLRYNCQSTRHRKKLNLVVLREKQNAYLI